jgi:hypothetical protein
MVLQQHKRTNAEKQVGHQVGGGGIIRCTEGNLDLNCSMKDDNRLLDVYKPVRVSMSKLIQLLALLLENVPKYVPAPA